MARKTSALQQQNTRIFSRGRDGSGCACGASSNDNQIVNTWGQAHAKSLQTLAFQNWLYPDWTGENAFKHMRHQVPGKLHKYSDLVEQSMIAKVSWTASGKIWRNGFDQTEIARWKKSPGTRSDGS